MSKRLVAVEHPDLVVGWREWVALPELGLLALRAKVDTGARTSALHAFAVEPFTERGEKRVRFRVHPFLRRSKLEVACEATVVDMREVRSSSGHLDQRVVVGTVLRLGPRADAPAWPIELTLADRGRMRYPMLLGREALEGRLLVNPARSFIRGQIAQARAFYTAGKGGAAEPAPSFLEED